ncbi:hypothetical protein BU15DRAFT_73064 [Melanogaster broomeanus]|nr:hypothetical protein BU15DRAFT_73064 [Melanogaster broomeanus]
MLALSRWQELGPCLKFSTYLNYMGWTNPTRITPVRLINLFAHCPKLTELGIAVDFTTLTEQFPAHPPNTSIKLLEAGTSPIDEPVAVAELLARIMLNVRSVVGFVVQDTQPMRPRTTNAGNLVSAGFASASFCLAEANDRNNSLSGDMSEEAFPPKMYLTCLAPSEPDPLFDRTQP